MRLLLSAASRPSYRDAASPRIRLPPWQALYFAFAQGYSSRHYGPTC